MKKPTFLCSPTIYVVLIAAVLSGCDLNMPAIDDWISVNTDIGTETETFTDSDSAHDTAPDSDTDIGTETETFADSDSAHDTNTGPDSGVETDAFPDALLSVSRPVVFEGTSETTTPMHFSVSISTPVENEITFDFTTADASAISGFDYIASSGGATIPAGETSTTVTVEVTGDTLVESNEMLQLIVDNVVGAAPSEQIVTGEILNDDNVIASNWSTSTTCSEEDNVNIALSADAESFGIEASHPAYDVTVDDCSADFTGCTDPGATFHFSPLVVKQYDDGTTVVEAVREAEWWQPQGMSASVNSGAVMADTHYIRIYRKIENEYSWTQVLVLYSDGNLRLIPQPPEGVDDVCFGSSVLIGPVDEGSRPFAEITSVDFVSSTNQLNVQYATGGDATIRLVSSNRTATRVRVDVSYPTGSPIAMLRSMYVAEDNADVAIVDWRDALGESYSSGIMSFEGSEGVDWFFSRAIRSLHNVSAPDIHIFFP